MPLTSLHLVRFHDPTRKQAFLQALTSTPRLELILASEPRFLVIRPSGTDTSILLPTDAANQAHWHLLLLLKSTHQNIPSSLKETFVASEYVVQVGIPSKILFTYPDRNAKLCVDAPNVRLTGSLERARDRKVKDSAQSLELSPDLLSFADHLTKEYGNKPVTMLNLLSFREGGKEKYYQYGQAFIKVAGLRGGDAKIVGNAIKPSEKAGEPWWNEVSLVHYPSIQAFCDMLAGDDYQEINTKYRLAALRDTLLLCTTEVGLDSLRRDTKL